MVPDARAGARPDVHGHASRRQPGAGRLGDQEHGDRSERGRRRRRLSDDRAGAGLHHRAGGNRGDQRRASIQAGDVMVLICRGPMGAGMEETYQITSALQASAVRQARRGAHRCALQRRLHRRLHRPRLAGSAGRRADRQSLDGDTIEIVIDRVRLEGTVNIVDVDLAARKPRRTSPPIQSSPTTASCGPCSSSERRSLGRVRVRL